MAVDLQVEHIAINVKDPLAVADWYCQHLNMKVVRRGDGPVHMHFLADASGRVVLELYSNPPNLVPDYSAMHPQVLHIAFVAEDIAATRQRLIEAGASSFSEVGTTPAGDQLAMLRDPWGFAMQLCQRNQPMA